MYTTSTALRATRIEHSHRMMFRKGALVSIARPKAHAVECVRGLIWITHDNDPHDIFLSAGQRHLAVNNARMIVQSLERSEVRFQVPQERRPAAFLGDWMRFISGLWAHASPVRQTASAVR